MMKVRRILIVDGDPDDRALAATLIRARLEGSAVDEAADGLAFATHLARGDFDAVVVERHLGWADGLRILSTVKDFYPGRPVVLFTGSDDPDLATEAVRLGADGLVPKTSRGYLRLVSILAELLDWVAEASRSSTPAPRPLPAPPPVDRDDPLARAVAHDLQEPLQLVTRYSRLVDERFRERLGDDGRRLLGNLASAAERLQRMVDDLLEYSRLGSARIPSESVDLEAVVDEALANLDGAIQDTGARITRDPLPTVHAHRRQMVRLFQNLIGNALKFRGEAPPRVHVGANRDGTAGSWRLSVRDNGIGIPPGDRERIFDMFQRLHTADEVPGSGVGLAICRRIAEIHGAALAVDSALGTGSTFTLILPPEAETTPTTGQAEEVAT